jgi:predicted NBD/HSP70 family sugar kinase
VQTKIDQKTGRAINRRLVLNVIRQQGGLSRTAVANQTGLSPATVGFVVSDLIEEGILKEAQPTPQKRGRKPVPVEIDRGGHLAVGFKFATRRIDCLLTNLAMEPVDELSVGLETNAPEEFVAAAKHAVDTLMARPATVGRRIIAAGLTMPARVDTGSGDCVNSYRFGWRNVPITRMMSDVLGLSVGIEDDTLGYGLAHQLFGLGQGISNFMALAVGEGIGCASILDGQVRRGSMGNAGKVGHTLIGDDGPLCECGRRGCLQASFSATALETAWLAGGSALELTDAIRAEEPAALALVSQAGATIGEHLATWALLLDPQVIVLGGEAAGYGAAFVAPMEEAFRKGDYRPDSARIVVDDTRTFWAAGAAAVAVQQIFDFQSVPAAGLIEA